MAIVAHLKGSNSPPHHARPTDIQIGISPGKRAKLRKEYPDQLKDIQKLKEDGTLTEDEFDEEKSRILETLRSMK